MIVLNIHHKHTVSDVIPRWASYIIFVFLPKWIFIQAGVGTIACRKLLFYNRQNLDNTLYAKGFEKIECYVKLSCKAIRVSPKQKSRTAYFLVGTLQQKNPHRKNVLKSISPTLCTQGPVKTKSFHKCAENKAEKHESLLDDDSLNDLQVIRDFLYS